MPSDSTYATEAKITGRVQGVAFRAWTRSRARSLQLTGWVRNDPTGSVSARFQGEKKAVETMLTELWTGPAAASVRDVQSDAVDPDPTLASFDILR